jgi:hypothetical protein
VLLSTVCPAGLAVPCNVRAVVCPLVEYLHGTSWSGVMSPIELPHINDGK